MSLKHSNTHSKANSTHTAHIGTSTRSQIAKRRSNRMSLKASVGMSGEDRQKSAFSISAKATNLNKHGAAVQTNRELAVGLLIQVRNKQGVEVPARIVALLAASQGSWTYGIEFAEHDDNSKNFSGISFPSNA